MAKSALNFYQFGKYHLEAVRNGYKSMMKEIILPESGSISVVDVGCGSGRVLNEVLLPLLPENVSEIIGTDMDENMLDFCRSMNNNSKVSFEKLNIIDEKMPKHLENRFDLLFSSYCFSYISNWRRAFSNCSRLLKPNGELFLISQFKTNALYTTYKKMASMDRWKPYTSDYMNYVPPFSCKDPDSELKKILQHEDVRMELKSHKFDHDFFLKKCKKDILDIYLALDTKALAVPSDQQNAYVEDFTRIFSEVTDLSFDDKNTYDNMEDFIFPTVFIHARNIKI